MPRIEDILSEVYNRTQRSKPGPKDQIRSIQQFTELIGVEEEMRVHDKSWPKTNGLLCWWSMDAAAISGTTLKDWWGDGGSTFVDGTITGATQVPGFIRGALSFNGVGNNISFGSPALLDDLATFTYEMFIYPLSSPVDSHLLNKLTKYIVFSATQAIQLVVLRASTPGSARSTTYAVPLNAWTHIAATWDPADLPKLYVNGVEVSYVTQTAGSGAASSDAISDLVMSPLGAAFHGYIDELRIYNRVLAASEVLHNYRAKYYPIAGSAFAGEEAAG